MGIYVAFVAMKVVQSRQFYFFGNSMNKQDVESRIVAICTALLMGEPADACLHLIDDLDGIAVKKFASDFVLKSVIDPPRGADSAFSNARELSQGSSVLIIVMMSRDRSEHAMLLGALLRKGVDVNVEKRDPRSNQSFTISDLMIRMNRVDHLPLLHKHGAHLVGSLHKICEMPNTQVAKETIAAVVGLCKDKRKVITYLLGHDKHGKYIDHLNELMAELDVE